MRQYRQPTPNPMRDLTIFLFGGYVFLVISLIIKH